MKKLVYILVLAVMACGVACCNRYGETEARLVAIDSLVCDQPDSALSLLADINGDSLPTDLQAYHSLLTVQALYKAYIPATSDTLIRRAWDYYRDHGPYDRRIRAMLYMGTVAEELGHPDSAMRWYKRTELESRPDDHYHRGYALMSMAYLYRTVDMSMVDAAYKYKEALNHFDKSVECDTSIYMFCITQLGTSYRTINGDSAHFYLSEAIKLCDKLNFQLTKQDILIGLAGYYYSQEDFNNTIFYAKKAVQSNILDDNQLLESCYYISLSFSEIGNVDSAKYYFNLMPKCVDSLDSIKYLSAKAEIENLIGHHNNYLYLSAQSDSIADTWLISSQNNGLKHIEIETSREISSMQIGNYLLTNNKYKIIVLLLIAIVCFTVCYFYRNKKKYSHNIKNLQNECNATLKQIDAITNKSSNKQSAYLEQLKCLRDFFDTIMHAAPRKKSSIKSDLKNVNISEKQWTNLCQTVNVLLDGFINDMSFKYDCSEIEVRVFCFCYCGGSNNMLELCLQMRV